LGHKISDDVINFIAQNIKSSVRDLEGAIKKLIAEKLFLDEDITIDNARKVLNSYITKSDSVTPTIAKIQKIIANFYNIKISDLNSTSRLRSIARPRQVAMYLAKNFTNESLPRIGDKFGGKNHATVIHSCKTIESLIVKDLKLANDIKSLEDKLS
jgi:chromosomal replication initiator protein